MCVHICVIDHVLTIHGEVSVCGGRGQTPGGCVLVVILRLTLIRPTVTLHGVPMIIYHIITHHTVLLLLTIPYYHSPPYRIITHYHTVLSLITIPYYHSLPYRIITHYHTVLSLITITYYHSLPYRIITHYHTVLLLITIPYYHSSPYRIITHHHTVLSLITIPYSALYIDVQIHVQFNCAFRMRYRRYRNTTDYIRLDSHLCMHINTHF